MEIVTREKFATSGQETHQLPQGLTINEMLEAVSWKPELRPWTYVTVDGRQVPAEIWNVARPKEGRRVLIALRPAGGGGGGAGKSIAMAVAAIAIMVVAWYAAPVIVGALSGVGTTAAASAGIGTGLGVAVAATQAGLAIAGTLALGALVRPGSLGRQTLTNSGAGGNAASESNSYGISGASNAISRYGVVPRVYGRHRVTPPFAAEPYVVSAGTSQTINLLLDFGYGPLLVEDIRVGNTPISNFPTARWFVHSEYKKGDPLYIYKNDQATLEVNAVLTELVDNVRVSPQAGSVVTLEFAFPGGLTGFTEQGASFQKDDHVTVFAAPENGAGGWQPISNFYPYALFQGEGGTQNAGAAQVGSVGVVRWSRGSINGFPQGFTTGDPVVQRMVVGSLFTYNGVGYTINGVEPNNLEPGQWNVKLANLPGNISWIYTHTGVIFGEEGRAGTFPLPGSGGASGPLWVTFGPSAYDVEFHGQTRTPRVVSVVMQMPYENKWQILVRRSTPVSNSSFISNQITWSSIRVGRWVAPIYPEKPRTIMELQITASEQISGQVQNINALCTSILKDPRNPGARIATRNPAWIYADILTGTANPRPVPWSRLDESKLIEWANKNEEKTVQGDIFATCDLIVDYRLTIGELCQNVCSTGRGAPTVVDGLYSVLLDDENKIPVQMFTNRNAANFQATRAWVDLPHALKVQYMSENTWNREEIIVYADGYSDQNATKFESLQLAGIVRPWQVWRFGRYYLAAAFLRRERLSFSTDVENLVCQRGDLVRVAHDHLLQNFAARVREIDANVLTMDAYLTTELYSEPFPLVPANAGSGTALPPGWGTSTAGAAGVTVTAIDRGQTADGTGYCDIRITKAAAGGTANAVQILTANNLYFGINSDDIIVNSADYEILSQTNFVGNQIRLATQPTNSTNGTGLGTVFTAPLPFPPLNTRVQDTLVTAPGSTLGVVNGWRPLLEFGWAPTTDYPATMDVRVYTPRHFINNPKPSLLARVDEVKPRLVPNAEGAGAVLGVAVTEGLNVFPDGWASQQWSGWTREVTRVAKVFEYWDIDIRFTAPAGTGVGSLMFAVNQDLPDSKKLFGRVQMRRTAVAGTAPTVTLVFSALDSAGVWIQNFLSGTLTLNTTNEIEVVHGPVDLSSVPNAERFTFGMRISPAAGAACDVTIRFRLPLVGDTTNPTSGLPAIAAPEAIYGQLRTTDGELVDSFPILARPAEDQVLVTQSIADQAAPGDLIVVGTLATETSDWLVDKITAGGDFAANIDLIEHAPGVLQADKGPIPPYVPNEGSGILTDLPPVRNLTLTTTPFLYTADGVPTHENLLQWDPPAFQVAFYIVTRLYVVPNPGDGITPPFQSENVLIELGRAITPRFLDTLDTRTLRHGGTLVRYSVVPVTPSGRRGDAVAVEATFLPDTVAPPALVFTTNVLSETTMLIWGRPNIPDLGGYQIRFVDTTIGKINPAWEDMVSVVDSVSPDTTSLTVHIQTGTYAIRAFDTSGNFGPPSYSVTNVETLPNVDEITRLEAGPTWAGTFDQTEVVGGELRLRPGSDGAYPAEGWFYATSAVDYPASWLFRVRGAFDLNVFPTGDDPLGDWNAQIWVSIQKSAPKLNSPWFAPLSNAVPLAGGPGVYVPLATVSQTDLVGRLINWAVRLTSRRSTITPSVKNAILIVDHSERREFGDDVATGTGGKNIFFSRPFFVPPSVAVTLNDGQTGDRIVKSVSTTALTVEVFNNAEVSVSRKIDWQAIGYGRGEI
jgi:hypothetical protein